MAFSGNMGRHWELAWGLGVYLGGCQNYGSFLGTLNIRCHIIIGTERGTLILTTTHL